MVQNATQELNNNENPRAIKGINPDESVPVRIGGIAQSHNRLVTTTGTTNPTNIKTMTWTEEEDVTSIRFKLTGATAGNLTRVVFDASPIDDSTDTAQAGAWLATATASETLDVEYFELSQGSNFTAAAGGGSGEWSEWFEFSPALRRTDFLSITAGQSIFAEVR